MKVLWRPHRDREREEIYSRLQTNVNLFKLSDFVCGAVYCAPPPTPRSSLLFTLSPRGTRDGRSAATKHPRPEENSAIFWLGGEIKKISTEYERKSLYSERPSVPRGRRVMLYKQIVDQVDPCLFSFANFARQQHAVGEKKKCREREELQNMPIA